MKTFCLLLSLLLTAILSAAELPTGQGTPEGVACDAVSAYIRSDSKAWLTTLIRPVYGKDGNKDYEEFKKQMVAAADKNKDDKSSKSPRIVKCFKARQFSLNGPASAAYALYDMNGNMFVDILIETAPGKIDRLRYHVLLDKDKKWYFEPRPDLNPMLSMGLNKESESKEVLYEAK